MIRSITVANCKHAVKKYFKIHFEIFLQHFRPMYVLYVAIVTDIVYIGVSFDGVDLC